MNGVRLAFVQLEEGGQSFLRWVCEAEKSRVKIVSEPSPGDLSFSAVSAARGRDSVPYWRVA